MVVIAVAAEGMVAVAEVDEAGRAEAFRALYLAEFELVLRFLTLGAGRDLAEDLCADTFCRAWDGWARFSGDAAMARHWLLRIARNRLIDHRRRTRRIPFVSLPANTPAPPGGEPEAMVWQALGRLRRADRELVSLRVAGLEYAELAAITGKKEAAIRKAYSRALERLRPLLLEDQR